MRSLVASRLITISISITLTTALLASALIHHTPRVAAQGSPACVAPPAGLVSWWPGDGHASDIQDGNNGTLVNGATYATAKVGSGFSLDGVDDRVEIPDAANLKPANVTVEAWVKFNALDTPGASTVGLQYIVFKRNSRTSFFEGYSLSKRRVNGTDRLEFVVASAGGVQVDALSTTAVSVGQFYHIAGTYDGNTARLYVNGVLEGQQFAGFPLDYGTRPVFIGSTEESWNGRLNGVVDEVEIFNRALSPSEILNVYNAGSAGQCKSSGIVQRIGGLNASRGGSQSFIEGSYFDQARASLLAHFPRTTLSSTSIITSGFLATVDIFVLGASTDCCTAITPLSASEQQALADFVKNGGTAIVFADNDTYHFMAPAANASMLTPFGLAAAGTIIGRAQATVPAPLISPITSGPFGTINGFTEIYPGAFTQLGTATPIAFNALGPTLAVLNPGSNIPPGTPIRGRVILFTEVTQFLDIDIGFGEFSVAPHEALFLNLFKLAFTPPIPPNSPPAARCQNVTASAGASCTANASIDNGSADPDGDAITITQSPAGPYALGTTTVTLTVTDSKGASSSCSAIVTVVDSTPPQITAPAAAGYQCLAQVPPGQPSQATATDNCSTPTITVADASNGGAGSTASPLVITRVFTAKDAAGNSNSATQTITVIDSTPPTITAPLAVNVTTGAGATACGATVSDATLGAATANDNCGSATVTRSSVPAGNLFPVGTTTITYTANDGHGNTASATQTVTVTDNTSPTITACAAARSAFANNNCQAAVPDFTGGVTASDNCGGVTITQSPTAGTLVSLGATTVTLTVKDAAGNSSACTTTFTVTDNTPPTITACAAPQSASTNANCQAALPDFTGGVTATDNCTASGSLTFTQSPLAGTLVGLGATPVTITVKDAANNTVICSTSFTVIDNTPPVISCPAGTTASADANCQAAVPNVLGGVTASDNCTPAGSLTKTQSPAAGTLVGLGTTTITVTVTDAAGNSRTCTTRFTVIDTTPPVITMPPAMTATTGAGATACGAVVTLLPPTGSDNCGGVTITCSGVPTDNFFPVGTTTITCTATDGSGNTSTATQQVTVIDNAPPVITACATNKTVSANASCQAAVPNLINEVATNDNCTTAASLTITQSPAAGTLIGLGTTTVTITVKDATGNTATCPVNVTVVDNTPPTINNCPSPITVYTGAGATSCSAPVSWIAPTASDNCGVTSFTSNYSPGATFPVGQTTVTYTAKDAAGNTTTCSFKVTVIDNTPPVITCPANLIVAGNILGSCAANVSVGTATASDNCGAPTITGTRSDGQALNAPYPLGTTTITWRATDAAGNQATCQQTVTVTNPAPTVTITGPATGALYAVNTPVNFTGSFSDNAGGTHTATWAFDSFTSTGTVNEATGAITGSFSFMTAGVYKVTLTVTDGCGGTGTADQVEGLTALVVIYDPNGGWVTGGGWINSPAGAYVANPSLVGKANFGFVSKYQNGATTPDGNTEFQFKAGNLNFHSTSYEWLVVAGARAQYKGAGTINGSGDYRFMLTAIDGDQPGGGGQDKFRIRIWNNASGGLVYDNQMNAPDNADPTTVLGGGQIVIHK